MTAPRPTRLVVVLCLLAGLTGLLLATAGAPLSTKGALLTGLAALATLLAERETPLARRLRLVLASALTGLALTTLLQQALNYTPELTAWPWGLVFDLAPLTPAHLNLPFSLALAFAFYGAALLAFDCMKSSTTCSLVHILITAGGTMAFALLLMQALDVAPLFDGAIERGSHWPVALALLILSAALYRLALHTSNAHQHYARHEDQLILSLAGLLLLLTALGAGLIGAGLVLRQSYQLAQSTLKQTQISKAQLFQDALDGARLTAERYTALVLEAGPLRTPIQPPRAGDTGQDTLHRRTLDAYAMPDGDRAVQDALARTRAADTTRIPLQPTPDTWLVHKDGWLLEQRTAVTGGTLVTRVHMPRLDTLLETKQGLGRTGVLIVCALHDEHSMDCLPSPLNPDPARRPLLRDGLPLPMARALAGEDGIDVAYDHFGDNVLSAYGPIGDSGLGMAQKIRTAELYAPLRERFWSVLGLILAITAAGVGLLWRVVHPLATRLVDTRAHLQGLTDSMPEGVVTTDAAGRITGCNPAAEALFECRLPGLAEMRLTQLFGPPEAGRDEARLYDAYGRLAGTGKAGLRLTGRSLTGRSFPVELTLTEFGPANARSFVAVIRDVTERVAAERALRANEQRLRSITGHIPGMVFQLHRAGDGTLAFRYVSTGALALCGAGSDEILDDANAFLSRIVAEDRAGFDTALQRSAVTLDQWSWEGRLETTPGGEVVWLSVRATPREAEDDTTLWDGVVLNITRSKSFEQALRASRASIRQLSAHREAVREAERKHIAREIHDELGQILTATKMEAAMLESSSGACPDLDYDHLKRLLGQAITTVRKVATSLRPSALDLGIESAAAWLAGEFQKQHGIACHTRLDADIELDEARATAVFRILQEALTNIARHAGATRVDIALEQIDAELCLSVRDNGRGFDPELARQGGGFGLRSLAERVLMLGGSITLDSAPGQGTALRMCLPLDKATTTTDTLGESP